ncbi:MAG: endonuclease/exonuclease/phosphatase family protein [Deltaproteobacteria bacterium]|nr:endonuclease/exonuclease/phosphatase family protein [Deltaproteobacteria bacterium]
MAPRGLVALALVLLGACEPFADPLDEERARVPVFERAEKIAPPASPSRLRVMTWNVKYGACRIDFWFDGWGDRVQMTPTEVRGNLDAIEGLIREVEPDVLLVNELEVNSRRSAYVDMQQDFLDHTSLNYGAYFQAWDSRYIPSEGLGRVDMGIAIFSRYPITFAERIRQPDQTDLDVLRELFYLHTVVGHARVDVGEREVGVFVTHVSAYDTDGTKQRQLAQLLDLVGEETLPFVLGGDFNELPPNAVKRDDFADEAPSLAGTEFEQPPYTPEAMQPFFARFTPAITLERIGETEVTQSRYYTHSIRGPNRGGTWTRQLDHLFVDEGSWAPGTTDVLQGPGRLGITSDPNWLSDHAPVVGTWVLPP